MKGIASNVLKRQWFALIAWLCGMGLTLHFLARPLVSFLLSIVFAYLLLRPVKRLERAGVTHIMATVCCVLCFFLFILTVLLGIIPPMLNQVHGFLDALPNIMGVFQALLNHLATHLPNYLSPDQILRVTEQVKLFLTQTSSHGVLYLINLIPLTFEVLLYLILVPTMLFFLLKDYQKIFAYFHEFMPSRQTMLVMFWQRLDQQLGRYLQGKCMEMVVVGILSMCVYAFMGMQFALLMGCLMGLGVLIPIIGPALVSIGVACIAFWQFLSTPSHFMYLLIAHGMILLIDNNLLVPYLFSDKLNLHPLAILVATLLFGALFGFWGLFFAIPMLTALHILADLYKLAFMQHDEMRSA